MTDIEAVMEKLDTLEENLGTDKQLRTTFAILTEMVEVQANDEGLWFIAMTGAEGYLQQELRRLHALIEGCNPS